ncbi:hypothetical protein LA66_06450 [Aureimonas altamirensis]|uniref:Uncharacterized protein n=1 Tax=Aureimonas altamirensis TaxID=370622 RepID=A0A0B1Q734_9HYPH|nr:AsmA-like C-terminal region-containing protein [Aureimonas altamirensis]KHJ56219.1 hypothetical protein LA66_06450 [Aureimonas altamirensis]
MRLFIAIGGLVVALLIAALVAPLFIDWTSWRTSFEAEASRLLGQKVEVRGEAHARLLPFPSLTFTDVTVGEPGRGEASMTLDSFRMDAELAPYISGEIRIFQMELGRPHLTVPYGAGSRPPRLAEGLGAGGANVVLENVVITDGTLSLNNGSNGQRREFGDINASFSARTLRGPFRGGGTLTNRGERLEFTLSSGAIEDGGHWPFRIAILSQRLASSFTLDGATQLGDGVADFAGAVEIASPAQGLEPVADMPVLRATGQVTSQNGGATFQKIRVEVGGGEAPYVLTGEGTLASGPIPHFGLKLAGEQIDMDRLTQETLEKSGGLTLADRVEAVRRTLRAVPVLPVAGELELNLPVFTVGDTTVRGLSLTASPSTDGWALRRLNAELPGRTLVEASGLVTVGDTLAFRGPLLFASRQPAGLVAWLGGESGQSLAQIQRAGFSADVQLSPTRQVFENLEADVAGQSLRGRLERATAGDGVAVSADLAGDAVNLDNFSAFAELLAGEDVFASGVDSIDLRLSAGPLQLSGLAAETGEVDLTYSGNVLDLRNLSLGGFAGGDLEARGTIGRPDSGLVPDLAYEVALSDPARLAAIVRTHRAMVAPRLGGALADFLARSGQVTGSGRVAPGSEDDRLALTFNGTAGPSEITASVALPASIEEARADWPTDVSLLLASDRPVEMLSQLGAAGIDLGVTAPLELRARMSGPADRVATSLGAHAPGLDLTVEGTTTWSADSLSGTDATATLQAGDLGPWLSALGIAAGQGIDRLPADGRMHGAWRPDGWTVDDMSGSIADTAIEAAELTRSGNGPVTGAATIGAISLPWLATTVLGVAPEAVDGAGGWPNTAFGGSFTAQLPPFELAMTVPRIDLFDGAVLRDTRFGLQGSAEGLAVDGLEGTMGDGSLTGRASLANNGGFARAQVDLSLDGVLLDPAIVPLRGKAAGRLAVEAAGQSWSELFASADGGGSVSIMDAVLAGVSVPPLGAVLDAADSQGFEATSEQVSLLLRDLPSQPFQVDRLDAPVDIALGSIRVGPITAAAPGARLSGEGTFSLGSRRGEARATIVYAPVAEEEIEDTVPSVSYVAAVPGSAAFSLAGADPLTSYLSIRAYRAEQARLQAMRDDLQETLRLRREARYFNDLARLRTERAQAAAAEAERRRAEEARQRQEEAARAAEEARRTTPAPALPMPDLRVPPPSPRAPGEVVPPFEYELAPGQAPLSDLPGVDPSLR